MTLLLVNIFPARRARDILMLMGLLFAASLVIAAAVHPAGAAAAGRVAARPHRLLRDAAVADHAAAAVVLGRRDAVRQPAGRPRLLHVGALWTTALALDRAAARGAASAGTSPASARRRRRRKARFTQLARARSARRGALPLSPVRRQLLVKDLKIFLRDVSQWSQLLLLLALVLRLSLQLPRARSRSRFRT